MMARSALISDCGLYRYRLDRRWGRGQALVFVMLNPSTADGNADDPTIRRCIGFAKRIDRDAITVLNLFAYRATKPSDLVDAAEAGIDIAGPLNVATTVDVLPWNSGRPVICAWGGNATKVPGGARIVDDLRKYLTDHTRSLCLGVNGDGSPRHPLYVPGDEPMVDWR